MRRVKKALCPFALRGSRMRRGFGSGIVVAIGLMASSPVLWASQLLVLEVTGQTQIKPGDLIDASAALALQKDVSIVLVAADGKKWILSGPFRGRVDVAAAAGGILNLARISSLFQSAALVRGSGPIDFDPLTIDLSTSGDQCTTADPIFYHPPAPVEEKLVLQKDGREMEVIWPRGIAKMAWPAAMPAQEDALYTITFADETPVLVRLHIRPPRITKPLETLAWMAEKDCLSQTKAELSALPVAGHVARDGN